MDKFEPDQDGNTFITNAGAPFSPEPTIIRNLKPTSKLGGKLSNMSKNAVVGK